VDPRASWPTATWPDPLLIATSLRRESCERTTPTPSEDSATNAARDPTTTSPVASPGACTIPTTHEELASMSASQPRALATHTALCPAAMLDGGNRRSPATTDASRSKIVAVDEPVVETALQGLSSPRVAVDLQDVRDRGSIDADRIGRRRSRSRRDQRDCEPSARDPRPAPTLGWFSTRWGLGRRRRYWVSRDCARAVWLVPLNTAAVSRRALPRWPGHGHIVLRAPAGPRRLRVLREVWRMAYRTSDTPPGGDGARYAVSGYPISSRRSLGRGLGQ
jgi:hypothetical protein